MLSFFQGHIKFEFPLLYYCLKVHTYKDLQIHWDQDPTISLSDKLVIIAQQPICNHHGL